jgi:hypothetical protein
VGGGLELRPQPIDPHAGHTTSETHHRRTSLAIAASLAGAGLASQAGAYRLARADHSMAAQALFLLGLMLEFVPCAYLLTRADTQRTTRVLAGLIAGWALLAASWLAQPGIFPRYDELLHTTSLWRLLDERRFFLPNSLIPISPYYPGLEVLTAGVHWATGLSAGASQIAVVLVARTMLLVSLFLLVERISHSGRAAGVAIALYVANPEFYIFDAQYAYETLALALAVTSVYYAVRTADRPNLAVRGLAPCVFLLALLAVTHHLTSWFTLLTFFACAIWLKLCGRSHSARVFGVLAAGDLVIVGGWTLFVGRRLTRYLGPITKQAARSFMDVALHRQGSRTFLSPAGSTPPGWERALVSGSAAAWLVLLVATILSSRGRKLLRERRVLWLLCIGSATYPIVLALHLSPVSRQYGDRAAAFVFVIVASWVAVWAASNRDLEHVRFRIPGLVIDVERTRYWVTGLVVLTFLMVGGVLFGAGSMSNLLPGRYLVEADQRSVDAQALLAARWAASHVPPETRIAADRDNAALLAAVGHLDPVTGTSGSVDVGPLYFANSIGRSQIQLIESGKIRLVFVDRRLAGAVPASGYYFESVGADDPYRNPNARARMLTVGELTKFGSWTGALPIYRHGPITIYDISAARGLRPVPISSREDRPGVDNMSWVTLCAALALSAYLLVTRRAGAGRSPDPILRGLDILVGSVLGLTLFGALLIAIHIGPTPFAVALMVTTLGYLLARNERRLVGLPVPHPITALATTAAVVLTVSAIVLAR